MKTIHMEFGAERLITPNGLVFEEHILSKNSETKFTDSDIIYSYSQI